MTEWVINKKAFQRDRRCRMYEITALLPEYKLLFRSESEFHKFRSSENARTSLPDVIFFLFFNSIIRLIFFSLERAKSGSFSLFRKKQKKVLIISIYIYIYSNEDDRTLIILVTKRVTEQNFSRSKVCKKKFIYLISIARIFHEKLFARTRSKLFLPH